ncbi:hypothetical protein EV182_007598, partial [Spiromyces aspiralis]
MSFFGDLQLPDDLIARERQQKRSQSEAAVAAASAGKDFMPGMTFNAPARVEEIQFSDLDAELEKLDVGNDDSLAEQLDEADDTFNDETFA